MRASQAHAPSVHDPERPGISRGTYYDVPRDSGLDRMRIYDDEQTAAQWEAALENERRSNGLSLFTVLPRYRAQMHGIIPEHMLRPPRNATMQEIARAAERVVQAEEAWLEQEQEARDDRERNEAKKAARKRKKKRQFVDGGMWPMDDAASDEGASAAHGGPEERAPFPRVTRRGDTPVASTWRAALSDSRERRIRVSASLAVISVWIMR